MGRNKSTRRQWLAACGTVATLGGCSRLPDQLGLQSTNGGREPSSWAMVGNEPTHTGYAPTASLDTPSPKWTVTLGTPPSASPVVAGDQVFVTSEGGGIRAFDLSGTKQWHTRSIGVPRSTPAVNENATTLFVSEDIRKDGDKGGSIRALSVASGAEQWRTKLGGNETAVFAPTVVDGTVYVCTDTGLVVLDAADGTIRWKAPSGQKPLEYARTHTKDISPAVTDDMVYVPDPDGVRAIDRADHSLVWEKKSKKIRAAPAVTDSTVYVTDTTAGTYALDRDTGEEQWANGYESWTSPAVADGRVYITSGFDMMALNASDGSREWQTEKHGLHGDIYSSIAVGEDFLVTGSITFGVVVLNASGGGLFSGPITWKSSEAGTRWSPAIANNSIYAIERVSSLSHMILSAYG